MKSRLKLPLIIIIAAALLLTFASAALSFIDIPTSFALTYGDWEYTVNDGEATVTKYNGSAASVSVPSELDGHPVTAIGEKAFYACETLKSIDIPASVKAVGDWAFFWCHNLTSLELCEGVTSIGSFAFSYCESLEAADLSACLNLQNLPDHAFYNCELLGETALPASLTSIGEGAFEGCPSLKTVNFCGSEEDWQTVKKENGGLPETADVVFNYGASAPDPAAPVSFAITASKDVIDVGETVTFTLSVPSIASVRSGAVSVTFSGSLELVSGNWLGDYRLADFQSESGSGVFLFDAAETLKGDIFSFSLRLKENTAAEYGLSAEIKLADGDFERGAGAVESKISFGHTPLKAVVENDASPTCTEKGHYDEVVYCDVCGEELSRNTVTVPEKGHTPDEAIKENDLPPTEDEEGHYDCVVYCHDCGAELSRDTVNVPPIGVKGDLNGDDNVNDADVVYLLYHIFFPEDYPLIKSCDFDGSGEINDADAVYLLYHIFFPDDYPLN